MMIEPVTSVKERNTGFQFATGLMKVGILCIGSIKNIHKQDTEA